VARLLRREGGGRVEGIPSSLWLAVVFILLRVGEFL
jgi:hypothetical protein